MTAIADYLVDDSYAPATPKPSLQQYDNYQIYTLICTDYPVDFEYLNALPKAGVVDQTDFWGIIWDMDIITNYQVAETLKLKHFLAIQTYSVNPVLINFVPIAQNCTIQPRNKYEYSTYSITRNIRTHSGYITVGYTPQYDYALYDYEESLAYSNPIDYHADPFYFIDRMNNRFYDIGYLTNGISYIIRNHSVGQITYQHFNAQAEPPNYRDLTDRYLGDNRVRPPDNPTLTLSKSGTIKISYYRRNPHESIPGLVSIDWMEYAVVVKANTPTLFPIINPVFGTLIINGDSELVTEIKQKLAAITLLGNQYGYSYYFHVGNVPAIWAEWVAIYNAIPLPAKPSNSLSFRRKEYTEYYQPIVNVLAANNNVWNNSTFAVSDINFDITHPMFEVNDTRAYNWHVRPQPQDKGIGDLLMDSPRTIEIHKALQAQNYLTDDGSNEPTGQHTLDWFIKNSASDKIIKIWKALGGDKFATNSLDPLVDRVSNLGWYVQNIARVLGIRVDDNGKINREKERSTYQPLTLQNPNYGDSNNNYSLTCWGDKGRVSPYLPNTYKDGKLQTLFDVYADIPQMLEACMRQLNTSLSIQHGSEIRVRGLDNKVQSYPNQLAVSLECLHRLEKINLATQKSLVTGVVVGAEVRELFSAVGVPVTNKYLPLYDSATGRTVQLPYFGHQKNKPSLAGELATVKINLAVQTGMMAPKKSNNIFNPFSR